MLILLENYVFSKHICRNVTAFFCSQCPAVRVRKRKHKASLSETEDVAAEKKIIKMKKLLRMEKRKKKCEDGDEQGDSGVDVARDSSDSDKDQEKTITQASSDCAFLLSRNCLFGRQRWLSWNNSEVNLLANESE